MKFWKGCFALALVVATGCAGANAYREAKDEESLGHWDVAVMKYARAVELNPDSAGYKTALARARLRASQVHFEKGKMYRASGRPDLAAIELEQTVLLDPTNDYAVVELRKAHEDLARQDAERSADSRMEKLKKKTRGARAVTPMLEPSSDRPINLNFPQPKPIKQIYRALADAAGINVVFDPQLKDDNISIVLTQINFLKALETLIRQENHFYKIIDEKTILIAADTPQNRKTYEDLVIRTFFLSNADVTEVANALRALLQTTRISVNKAENSITLRDTSDKVAVAERIVEQNDKQVAEVVVDVELMQINATKAQNLGIQLVPRAAAATIPAPGGTTNLGAALGSNQFTWDQLKQIGISSFGFTIPSVVLTFIKDNTDAELLAKPQLRIAEGQKAQLLIGDKVPIPVSSFSTSNVVGSNIVPITSYQYQDIGIKIEVEPRVHHNKEVTLKLMTEVSNISGYAPAASGQQPQPIIGTRTISSNIRLKDGETNFLAGLYRTDKSNARETIPLIGDIPVLGRIFSKVKTDNSTTDLVLTLTPHIIRIPDVTEEDLTPVYVGTDANISYQGSPRVETPARDAGPFEQKPGRPGVGRQPPQPQPQPGQPPAGVNLAPGSGPTDIFRPPPAPTPPPRNPRESVPPQASTNRKSESAAAGDTATAGAATLTAVTETGGTSQVLLDFDPAYLALGPGQQQSVLVRATSAAGFPGGTLTVTFDPSVASVVVARPILGSGSGVADANIRDNHVVLEIPASPDLTGTRAVAEVTLRGMAAGRSTLAFAPTEMPGASVATSQAVVDVR
jgi:general secretion pathway protein D